MRRLLAELFNGVVSGVVSRREFTGRVFGMGFGLATVESILDTVRIDRGREAEDASATGGAFRAEPFSDRTPYEQWMAREGVPVHTGYYVPDVRALELKPWKRLGTPGALIDLEGAEGTDGAYVFELAPGASTTPQRYLFEESVYVLDGEGETVVWHEPGHKQTLRWRKRTLFSPPLNTWRQHFNRGQTPARLLAVTDLPLVMDLFHSAEFIFSNDFVFSDRYGGEPGYFTVNRSKMRIAGSAATFGEGEKGAVGVLDTGLIPDLNEVELFEAKARGLKNRSAEVILSDNSMQSHISEFEVGTYKRAHRHGPGSHVLALGGVGYTLMWTNGARYTEAPRQVRVDWKDGTLFVPPDRWFHQHFNAGETPAKYMATTWIGGKYFVKGLGGGGRTHRLNTVSVRHGGNMVDYPDEDPAIRALFEEELHKNGVAVRMPPRD